MIVQLIDRIPQLFSPWVYAPLLFIAWLLVAFNLKRLLIKYLLQMTQLTSAHFDDLVVSSTATPLSIVIVGSGILFLSHALPLSAEIHNITAVLFRCSIIAAAVLFIDQFFLNLLESYKDKVQVAISPVTARVALRSIILGTGGLIFLSTIGISITPVLASLGIGSLAVGLALQDTLSNFFSGIYIAFDKPVRVGDYVRLESSQEGYITEIGWRTTRILMLPNNMVLVPNNKITSAIITNYYLPDREIAILVDATIHYQNDLEKAERLAVETAREIMKKTAGAVPNFEPYVRFHTFAASGISFTVFLRGREFVDQFIIKHEFIKLLQSRYRKEGILFSYGPTSLEAAPHVVEMFQPLPKTLSK